MCLCSIKLLSSGALQRCQRMKLEAATALKWFLMSLLMLRLTRQMLPFRPMNQLILSCQLISQADVEAFQVLWPLLILFLTRIPVGFMDNTRSSGIISQGSHIRSYIHFVLSKLLDIYFSSSLYI